MTILSNWREQYDRMLRSRRRLIERAMGQVMASPDEARDMLFHLFQDAYHLKDWIKNDSTAVTGDVEKFVKAHPPLALCGDLCNGTKHYKLTSTKTGDLTTSFASQSVSVRPGVAVGRASVGGESSSAAAADPSEFGPRPALHSWEVLSAERVYDALTLADEVVATWKSWLEQERLLP